jgi:hypothetical protein
MGFQKNLQDNGFVASRRVAIALVSDNWIQNAFDFGPSAVKRVLQQIFEGFGSNDVTERIAEHAAVCP